MLSQNYAGAIFGSVERFFGILVENYAGEFALCLTYADVC
jgi:threonyl-tRNA synthetase